MRKRQAALLGVTALAILGLSSCGSSTSSTSTTTTTSGPTPSTSGAAPPATGAGGANTARLCADIAAFSQQEQGLVTAEQTAGSASGSVNALQSYAKKSKAAFDQSAARITSGLASAPPIVQSAWATLQPQMEQFFQAAATATSLSGFTRAATSIEATNGFISANQTLSAFTRGVCPTAPGTPGG